jgi:KamA family protein/D-alanine--D-alanine ligase
MRVAVVRNYRNKGVINRFGRPCPEVYGKKSVQRVVDALRAGNHTVAEFEGDKYLLSNLEKFMPSDPQTREPSGIVFNMCYGIQGECRYTHLPAELEMAGVPYTGSSPLGHTLSLDKVITKTLLRQAGIPTPNWAALRQLDQSLDGLRFPLIVKPRHESTSYGLHLARDHEQLEEAVADVVTQYGQDALVEQYVPGTEVCAALIGNDDIEVLPIVELDFHGRDLQTVTWEDKYHKTQDEPTKICPARLPRELVGRVKEISLATFRACHCRDYARVDIRIDPAGNPFVLEVNSMASLGPAASFVLAAQTAGYSFESLVARILDVAHQRCFGIPAPADARKSVGELKALPFALPTRYLPKSSDEHTCPNAQSPYHAVFPSKQTEFYSRQIRRNGYYDDLRPIIEPSVVELDDSGSLDTSGENDSTVLTGLQHKYPQTAVVLITNECFAHCRYCFRKRIVGTSEDEVATDFAAIAEYIRAHPQINNVLLSGGDPFVLSTDRLNYILGHFLPIAHLTSIRFGTRSVVYYPLRFRDKSLVALFKKIRAAGITPVLVTHINHIGEISKQTRIQIRKLARLGVQFYNQAVLLRGVNDDPDILAATFDLLHSLGVRPYYLFQARPVKGALQFQVPLRRAIKIVHGTQRRLSGIQKTFRYIMSHYSGKIEILDIGADDSIYMRYHQCRDISKVGTVFSRPCIEDACWLDTLPSLSDADAPLELCHAETASRVTA